MLRRSFVNFIWIDLVTHRHASALLRTTASSTIMFPNTSHKPRHLDTTSQLWGHLLQPKSDSSRPNSDSTTMCPPIAPTDKTATSIRILLHDTRANLEDFSTRVHKLTDTIDETKREISGVQKLFQVGHEQVIEEVVSLGVSRGPYMRPPVPVEIPRLHAGIVATGWR